MSQDATLVLAHDVGTSGVKSVLTSLDGRIEASHVVPYGTYFPQPGWAEQEAGDWWRAVCTGTQAVRAAVGAGPRVTAVTFSTQMLGVVPVDRAGAVLRRPIIWLDARAGTDAAAVMRRFGGPTLFQRVAGATLTGKDAIPKLRWLRRNEPAVWERMTCFLDVGGYLIYRCTGRMVMEWSGASTYGLDLKRKTWLASVMRYAGVDPAKLPALVRPNAVVGPLTPTAAADLGLPAGTPVVSGMGDAPAAAVGAGAVRVGDAHACLGTSGWVGVLTDGHPTGRHGIAVIQSGDPALNLLIAEMETSGECLQWVADELYRPEPDDGDVFARMDRDAETVLPGSDRLLFTPWMYGERVPVADTLLRSAFLNLGAGHHRQTMVRAVMEGVCFNYRWTLDRLARDFHSAPAVLRVVGGGARSPVWMRILADVTHRRVEIVDRPQDAGAVGAALAAGVALGVHPGFDSLRELVRVGARFEPRPEHAQTYDFLYQEYRDAYRRLRGLYHQLNRERVPAGAT